MSAEPMVTVPAWTVLYAIRYGLNRLTYANRDALHLCQQHVDLLHSQGWADQVAADIDSLLHQCRTGALDVLSLHELAAWERVRDRLREVQP